MRGLLELRVTMDGVGRHDKLGQPFTLLIPFHSVNPDVKLFSRSSWANLGVKITDDELEKCGLLCRASPDPYKTLPTPLLRSSMLVRKQRRWLELGLSHIFLIANVRFGLLSFRTNRCSWPSAC